MIFFEAVFFFASAFEQCFLCSLFSLHRLFCAVYTVLLARHNVLIIENDECSHLGKTIDALIIGNNLRQVTD